MNILVIGNGFDLAHGLPTRYADFLKYIKKDDFVQIDEPGLLEEFKNLTSDNIFLKYFMESIDSNKGWVDFEKEISEIIQSLDYMRKNYPNGSPIDQHDRTLEFNFRSMKMNQIIKCINSQYTTSTANWSNKKYDDSIIVPLENALNELIRCLEIYLVFNVSKQKVSLQSSDISSLKIDKVLSFNYTNTYQEIYGTGDNKIEYDFIHGNVNINYNENTNNMVLGIDEYLNDEARSREVDFIKFKKYFQRIYKETGCKYKEWINKIEEKEQITTIHDDSIVPWVETNIVVHKVYIFGHSLDITDKDILRELILHDNVVTTIFYLNKKVYAQQIANLVKVIGQDELIKRVSEPNKTIIFKQQQDMTKV